MLLSDRDRTRETAGYGSRETAGYGSRRKMMNVVELSVVELYVSPTEFAEKGGGGSCSVTDR